MGMLFRKKTKTPQVLQITNTAEYIEQSRAFENIETIKALRDYLILFGVSPIIMDEVAEQIEEIGMNQKIGTFLDGYLKWSDGILVFQKHEDDVNSGQVLRNVSKWSLVTELIYNLILEEDLVLEIETKKKPAYMFKLNGVVAFRGY